MILDHSDLFRPFYILNMFRYLFKDLYVLLKTECVLAQSTQSYKKFYDRYKNYNISASLRRIHCLMKTESVLAQSTQTY